MKQHSILLYIIIGINVLLWAVLQTGLGSIVAHYGMKINTAITAGEWWRVLTAGFLHYDALHIFSNMYSLYYLWLFLDKHIAEWRILAIYLISIIAGGIGSYWFSVSNSLGASGGVFGLFGAAIVLGFMLKKPSLIQNLLQVIMVNLFIGLVGSSFIDNWAHIGGLVGGIITSMFILRRDVYLPKYTVPLTNVE